jgi:hypothetical protein
VIGVCYKFKRSSPRLTDGLKFKKYTIAWPQTARGCSQCDRLWNQVAWREPSSPRKSLAGAIGLVSQTEVLAGVLAGHQRTAAPSIRRLDFPLTDESRPRTEQSLRYKDQRERKVVFEQTAQIIEAVAPRGFLIRFLLFGSGNIDSGPSIVNGLSN